MVNGQLQPYRVQLIRLEAITPLLLAIHGAIMLIALGGKSLTWALIVSTAVLGGVGFLLANLKIDLTLIRATILLVFSLVLLFNTGNANSFFLLWFFVIVSIYPLVLQAPFRVILPVVIAVSYLSLSLFPTGQMPEVVIWARTFLLLYIGLLTQRLGSILSEYAAERDAFIQQASDGIFITDLNGNFLEVNQSGCLMLGCSSDELLRMNIRDVIALDADAPPLRFAELLDGKTIHSERLMRHKDGRHIPVEISARMINGRKLQGIIRDATERRQADEKTHATDRLLRNVLDTLPAFVGILAPDGTLLDANRLPFETFGLKRNEVIGLHLADIFPWSFSAQAQSRLRNAIQQAAQGKTVHYDLELPLPGGESTFVSFWLSPIMNESGQVIYLIPSGLDITEHKRTEQALAASEARYRAFFENSMDAILLTSPDGSVYAANPAARQMLERTEAEIIQAGRGGLMDVTDPRLNIFLAERIREGRVRGELTMLRKDGTLFPVELSSALFEDGEGKTRTSMIIRDITERKQVENALRESESRFSKIFHVSPVGINMFDLSNNLSVDVNEAYLKIVGYSRNEIVGHAAAELNLFVNMDERDAMVAELSKVGQIYGWDAKLRQKSGGIRDVILSIDEIDIGGRSMGLVVALDITERKQAERKLSEMSRFLESIVAFSPVAIISYDVDGHVLTWNPAAEDVFGWKAEEVIGQIAPHIGVENLPQFHALRQRVLQGETLADIELVRQKKDGTLIVVNLNTAPSFNETGDLTGYIAIVTDITERKLANEKIQRQNQRLKVLREIDTAILSADSVKNVVRVALDHIGTLVDCQRASLSLLEPGGEALVFDVSTNRKSFTPSGTRIQLASFEDAFRILSQNQHVIIDDLRKIPNPPDTLQGILRDGLCSLCALPLFSQGEFIGALSMLSESPGFFNEELVSLGREVANQVAIAITQSNLLESLRASNESLTERIVERERLIEELSSKNAELERFTYTVSHDLRSPLVTIRGFLGYLEQHAASGDMKRLKDDANRISNAVEKMQELMNDLLELSRIGRFVNPSERVSFEELTRTAIELLDGQIQQRNVTVQIQPNLPTVYGDRQRLMEVLQNLIGNAIKYMGDQAEPYIEIGQRNRDAEMLLFYVKDNGIGIAPEYHDNIFGLFNKLNATSEGTGIGLALVKRIIEFHGGRVWVESGLGQGSAFYFTLPQNEA